MKKAFESMTNDYHLQDRLGYKLSRLSRIVQSRLDTELTKHDLTRLKWCVLSSVELEDHNSPSDLADHIGITRPAISRLLKAMIKSGLIERKLTDEDGRSRKINVTDTGRKKISACRPFVEQNQEYFLSKLSYEQRDALDQALSDMIAGEVVEFDEL